MSLLRTLVLTAFPLFLIGLMFLELAGPVAPVTLRAARSTRASLVQRAVPVAPARLLGLAAF